MKINIVIPMAGAGSRFTKAGFIVPKPLLNINGKPMIQVVCENLRSKKYDYNFFLICQKQMIDKNNFREKIQNVIDNIKIIEIDKLTDGQLSTVMLAKEYIDNDDCLLCANCDQYLDIDIDDFYDYAITNEIDGLIMTMPSDGNDKWSYSKVDKNKYVIETAEKKVISNESTTGLYFFKKGKYLVESGEHSFANDIRTNGEFYICPCYNYLINSKHLKFKNYNIYESMYGLGTPEDLCKFLVTDLSTKV